jgi:transposase
MEPILNEDGRAIRYSSGMYAGWFIKSVIAELEEGSSRQEVLFKYKIRPGTLDEWVRQHASAGYRDKKKMPTEQSRNAVVRAILSGRMTVEEAKAASNIRTPQTIRKWVQDYLQKENADLAAIKRPELEKKKSTSKVSAEREQIKILQQQLADEKLRVAALNTLIDVAEEQLKINIRKKPGAKQS